MASKAPKAHLRAPLAQLPPDKLGAISLNEAMLLRYFKKLPCDKSVWAAYTKMHKFMRWSNIAVGCLLVLTVFETPAWCNEAGFWETISSERRCASDSQPEGQLLMSGVPLLSIGMGLIVEYCLLAVVFFKILHVGKMQVIFKRHCGEEYISRYLLLFDYVMITVGVADAIYFSLFPSVRFRLAPFVRFSLAVSIPLIRGILSSFLKILVGISNVLLFLACSVGIFAWLMAMVLDDLKPKGDGDGEVIINQGFENFGNSIYTAFVAMTTANLPDVMVPTYVYSRQFVWMWMAFFILAVCIFMQVVLAVVYQEYQDLKTAELKDGYSNRDRGIQATFDTVKLDHKVTMHNVGEVEAVHRDKFEELLVTLRCVSPVVNPDDHLIKIIFNALDDDNNGLITGPEFRDMCDVLQYSFSVTKRDSCVKELCKGTSLGDLLRSLLDNGEEGPELGYDSRFPGCWMDKLVNVILGLNVTFIVIESWYDLTNTPQPLVFSMLEGFFSFVYLADVALKLCWWSWQEYWFSMECRIDFVTTMVLACAGTASIIFEFPSDAVRYLNMLRLVRLLKALGQVPAFTTTFAVIGRMLSTCQDVLMMNFLVLYLWSAIGVQLFGGELYEENPKFEGKELDYFSSNLQVYNFNDLPMGMVTLFFFMITGWVDPLSIACLSLAEHFTVHWILTCLFLVSFYVASPLLAFNVFTAFSIDVFCKLKELTEKEAGGETGQVFTNLKDEQAKMAEDGRVLHISRTAALRQAQVYRDMFSQDG